MDDTTLAKIAYQGYGEATGFKNYQGNPMPEWEALGDTIQAAWISAVDAILNQLDDEDTQVIAQAD